MSRVLSDPWLAAQYSHPNIANLHKDGYQQAIGKHILGKLMLLVSIICDVHPDIIDLILGENNSHFSTL